MRFFNGQSEDIFKYTHSINSSAGVVGRFFDETKVSTSNKLRACIKAEIDKAISLKKVPNFEYSLDIFSGFKGKEIKITITESDEVLFTPFVQFYRKSRPLFNTNEYKKMIEQKKKINEEDYFHDYHLNLAGTKIFTKLQQILWAYNSDNEPFMDQRTVYGNNLENNRTYFRYQIIFDQGLVRSQVRRQLSFCRPDFGVLSFAKKIIHKIIN